MDYPLISELLLERAVIDINVIEKHIHISLKKAITKRYEKIVMVLCKFFRIDSIKEISSALYTSRVNNYTEMIEYLENVNKIIKKWFSTVESNNSIECNNIINKYHININIKNYNGETALEISRKKKLYRNNKDLSTTSL